MKIVITAGPTREHLDPVRFLSNPSTGKMGFAIASAAARRGHDVTLIAGPVALKTPKDVRRIDVVSAREMLEAVVKVLNDATGVSRPHCCSSCCDSTRGRGTLASPEQKTVFISTAAVADWRPAECATSKLKKHQMSGTLKLVRNPDILKTVTGCLKVGFAAETDNVLAEASRKCREKGLSFIVANDVTEKGSGFGTDTNRVTFVYPDGTLRRHPLMTKRRVAGAILASISELASD